MRKLFTATLALALVGGVYLAAAPAVDASNMGFKLERSFRTIDGFPGRYFVAFPLYNGLGDTADSAMSDPCTGTPDGTVNADDALCDVWTSRMGQMTLSRFEQSTCSFEVRTIANTIFGISVSGGWTAALVPDDAYIVNAPFDAMIGAQENRAVLVGSHDPSYTGRPVALPGTCGSPLLLMLNLPYHTMYQTADEILCGLEGPMGWEDLDMDGNPDTCPQGIFDAATGAQITVSLFDNIDDANGTDNQFVPRTVTETLFGIQFTGVDFNLVPGDGYLVNLTNAHTPTTFLSPHF